LSENARIEPRTVASPLSLMILCLSISDDMLEPDSEDELFINEAPSLDDEEDDEDDDDDVIRDNNDVIRDNDDVSSFMMEEEEEDTTTYGSPGLREAFGEVANGANVNDQDTSSLGENYFIFYEYGILSFKTSSNRMAWSAFQKGQQDHFIYFLNMLTNLSNNLATRGYSRTQSRIHCFDFRIRGYVYGSVTGEPFDPFYTFLCLAVGTF
jgi:hypothetical protein